MMMEQSVCAYYRVYPQKCLLQTGICHRADFCKNLREYHRENNPYLIKIGSASQRLCHFQCSKVCTHRPWLMRLSGNCLTLTLSNFFLFTLFNFVFFNKRYFSCVFTGCLSNLMPWKIREKSFQGKLSAFFKFHHHKHWRIHYAYNTIPANSHTFVFHHWCGSYIVHFVKKNLVSVFAN